MEIDQSAELTAFYKAYLAWVENDAPAHKTFTRSYGLCHNVQAWCVANKTCWFDVCLELDTQFWAAGLNEDYPFNDSMWPADDYTSESGRQEMHLNEKRITWVKSHV